jgi:serine/threonine-protein kinase
MSSDVLDTSPHVPADLAGALALWTTDGGRRFAGYDLVGGIGRGTFGWVLRARHPVHGTVAVKVLRPEHITDNGVRERFGRESQLLEELELPCLPQFIERGEVNGLLYFAMECLEGDSLRDWLVRHARPSELEIVRIGLDLARALEQMHARNVIHRDLACNNVHVERVGQRIRLLDLGCARDLAVPSHVTVGAMGNPNTLDPMILRGDRASPESDLFSLGCVLYYLWAGEYPFGPSGTQSALSPAFRLSPPDPLSSAHVALGARLRDLVLRLLRVRRSERPQSAAEVSAELSYIGCEILGAAVPAPPVPTNNGHSALLNAVLTSASVAPEAAARLQEVVFGPEAAQFPQSLRAAAALVPLLASAENCRKSVARFRDQLGHWRRRELPVSWDIAITDEKMSAHVPLRDLFNQYRQIVSAPIELLEAAPELYRLVDAVDGVWHVFYVQVFEALTDARRPGCSATERTRYHRRVEELAIEAENQLNEVLSRLTARLGELRAGLLNGS